MTKAAASGDAAAFCCHSAAGVVVEEQKDDDDEEQPGAIHPVKKVFQAHVFPPPSSFSYYARRKKLVNRKNKADIYLLRYRHNEAEKGEYHAIPFQRIHGKSQHGTEFVHPLGAGAGAHLCRHGAPAFGTAARGERRCRRGAQQPRHHRRGIRTPRCGDRGGRGIYLCHAAGLHPTR